MPESSLTDVDEAVFVVKFLNSSRSSMEFVRSQVCPIFEQGLSGTSYVLNDCFSNSQVGKSKRENSS